MQNITNKLLLIFNKNGKIETSESLLKGIDINLSKHAISDELERISKGSGNANENDVVDFIKNSKIPQNKTAIYTNMVCD